MTKVLKGWAPEFDLRNPDGGVAVYPRPAVTRVPVLLVPDDGSHKVVTVEEWETTTERLAALTDEKARCPKCGCFWSAHSVTTEGTMAPCPLPPYRNRPRAILATEGGGSHDD